MSTNSNLQKCLECGKQLLGRTGQKFCNPNCKSAFHYRTSKLNEPTIYAKIENQLKLNRKILKLYYQSGKLKLDREELIRNGFDFNYFTNTGNDKAGKPYCFNFEFGLHELKMDGKYQLIIWQDYMAKKKN